MAARVRSDSLNGLNLDIQNMGIDAQLSSKGTSQRPRPVSLNLPLDSRSASKTSIQLAAPYPSPEDSQEESSPVSPVLPSLNRFRNLDDPFAKDFSKSTDKLTSPSSSVSNDHGNSNSQSSQEASSDKLPVTFDSQPTEIIQLQLSYLTAEEKREAAKVSKAWRAIFGLPIYQYLQSNFRDIEEFEKFFTKYNCKFYEENSDFAPLFKLMDCAFDKPKPQPFWTEVHIPTIANLLETPLDEKASELESKLKNRLQVMQEAKLLEGCTAEAINQLKLHQKIFLCSNEVILELAKGIKPDLEALSKLSADSINAKKFADIQLPDQREAVIKSNLFWGRLDAADDLTETKLDAAIQMLPDENGEEQPLEVIKYFLDRGVHPDVLITKDSNALHVAMHKLYEDGKEKLALQVINLALAKGMDINAPDAWGDPALHLAVGVLRGAGKEQLVMQVMKLLLAKGADPNMLDAWEITALDRTVIMLREAGKEEIALQVIEILLDNGADPNLKNSEDTTALEMVTALLNNDPEPNEARTSVLLQAIELMQKKSNGSAVSAPN